jgi:hypothetical protein
MTDLDVNKSLLLSDASMPSHTDTVLFAKKKNPACLVVFSERFDDLGHVELLPFYTGACLENFMRQIAAIYYVMLPSLWGVTGRARKHFFLIENGVYC